jgi:glucan phosphoethanolaminetransferase (alkaline phosphatase superfamily)
MLCSAVMTLPITEPMRVDLRYAQSAFMDGSGGSPLRFLSYYAATMLAVATLALYASSITRNGLWAILLTLPLLGVGYWTTLISYAVGTGINRRVWLALVTQPRLRHYYYSSLDDGIVALFIGGVILLILAFARVNHDSQERRPAHVVGQLALLLLALAAAFAAAAVASAFMDRSQVLRQLSKELSRSRGIR